MVGKTGGESHIQRSEYLGGTTAVRRIEPNALHSREHPFELDIAQRNTCYSKPCLLSYVELAQRTSVGGATMIPCQPTLAAPSQATYLLAVPRQSFSKRHPDRAVIL